MRLDVWAEDDTDAVYNIEAQKENTKNLPHRSRFYQALIDSKLLDPGEIDFSKMKDCYSIIIAPFDLFGEGLYQYTFQMNCNETGQPLNDGAIRIFLNTHGQNPEDISSELKELLYYMEHTTEDIFCSTPRLQEIKKHVNIVKSSEEIGVKYMQEWEEKILEKRKARAEGLAEGRAEGLAEGDYFRLIQQIKKKIEKSKNLIQIADELEETPENIESLYAVDQLQVFFHDLLCIIDHVSTSASFLHVFCHGYQFQCFPIVCCWHYGHKPADLCSFCVCL